jgi:syntaxin-binding protein 1
MLEDISRGTLDQGAFPYFKPPMDNSDEVDAQQASLRSAKPTWARNRNSTVESRQRVLVFMAGGATYSEARACYEVSKSSGKDIFLASSHMITPAMYVQQVGQLSVDRRRLDLPADRPKQKAPSHLFERNDPPKPALVGVGMGGPGSRLPASGTSPRTPAAPLPPQKSPEYDNRVPSVAPPTAAMASMTMNPGNTNGNGTADVAGKGKLEKKNKKEEGGEKEKKKRHFFGSKK